MFKMVLIDVACHFYLFLYFSEEAIRKKFVLSVNRFTVVVIYFIIFANANSC